MALAVFAVSWGSIFVRFCTAPSLVIAFYRLAFATLILGPFVIGRPGRGPILRTGGRAGAWVVASGLLLAAHFAAWVSSLALTTVASSVVLVSTQPVFSALFSGPALGEKAPGRLYAGATLSLLGTLLIAGGDLVLSPAHLWGDVLALAGAAAASGYFVIGRSVRADIPFLDYLFLVYGMAALFLGVMAVVARQPLLGHPATDTFWFLMMALVPSLVGHTGLNWAVRHLRVYYVNLAAFGEPILATLYAYLLFGERMLPSLWAGSALVFAGIALALPRRAGSIPVN